MGEAPLFCGKVRVCGKSRRQSLRIPIQTRSRSDKNVVDARLDKTSPSANVFKRSEFGIRRL